MTQEQAILKKQIVEKISAGEALSETEEFFYLTVVMGHSDQETETIISIAQNEDPAVLID